MVSEPWQEFLRRQGAALAGDDVRDFGDADAERRAAHSGDALVALPHLALIHATGADVRTFLNGQLTNDVAALGPGASHLSAWCSPKGRMLALFRVLPYQDGYLLQLPAALRDEVSRRLRMYVLRAKVTLTPADDLLVPVGLAGSGTPTLLRETLGAIPQADDAVVQADDGVIVLRIAGAQPRFELLVPRDRAPALWTALARAAKPAGTPAWTWHDIAAGIPTVLPATSDTFIPQETNLDLLGGVNFSKGCYTGQEIVARLHYRGRVKQRMYRARVPGDRAPQPGDPVYAAGAGQGVGRVVIGAQAAEGGYDLLAVLYVNKADAELHLGSAEGPRLSIEPLPYTVPTE